MAGVIADLLANARTFDGVGPTEGRSKAVTRDLETIVAQGDYAYPAGTAGGNEVQSIAQHVHGTGGTYTLTFLLHSGETFTTGNLAYNAITSAVQTALNTAASAVVGWTDGDIVVGGAALSAGAMTFTYSGASVAGLNHSLVSINKSLMTWNAAQGTAGAITTTTAGTGSVDAVQTMVKYLTTVADGALHVTGGTFTLSFAPTGQTPFTTAAIAWNAAHATIQTAINTANGSLGDDSIVVAGGDLSSANLTFTFSGTGVTHLAQPLITVDSTGLTATVVGTAGAASTSASGGTGYSAWAALKTLGILNGAAPEPGEAIGDLGILLTRGSFPASLSTDTIRALALEASYQCGQSQALYDALILGLGL